MANAYLSDAFADVLLRAWLTKDASVLPGSVWIGLTLALPSDVNGTGLVAPAAAEYGRRELVMSAASWVSMGAGSRSMRTAVQVVLPQVVATEGWGQVLGYTLYDAATGGVFLGYGIANPYALTAGMTPRLLAGTIVITVPVG